jgi:cellulose synthase/poly-beta-1,6-N-acetylglucosamine synthase-like glycosyltransferase
MLNTAGLLGIASIIYVVLSFLSTFTLFIILLLTVYHTPIVLAAVFSRRDKDDPPGDSYLPRVSVIIPVKNDASIAERSLRSVALQDYPRDKIEVVVVDGSRNDVSEKIKASIQGFSLDVKYVREDTPNGKPSALNRGLRHVSGELVAVLDADNMLEPDAFRNAVKYFSDSAVGAVQGVIDPLNEKESIWTRIASKEEKLWNRVLLLGRARLGLFTPLSGSCYFVSRRVLQEIGGFPNSLAEDLDLSLSLLRKGYRIVYAEDVRGEWETPKTLKAFIVQRKRWYRGYLESFFRNWRIIGPDRRRLDAEIVMAGPLLLVLSFLTIMWGLLTAALGLPRLNGEFSAYIVASLSFFSIFTLGSAMAFGERPHRLTNIIWVPLVYIYWFTMMLVAFYAFLQVLFRRPARWESTPK